MRIPEKGIGREELHRELEAYREHDVKWRTGRTWAYVYDPGAEAEEVIKHAYVSYLSENALDPTAFPSMLRFEREVIQMARNHLAGDDGVFVNFASGATESLILAVKTARDWARAHRPQITVPEMILPTTAHAAFHKAAHYLDVKPVVSAVDPVTFKADVADMRRAITPNTVLLVGSAVSYAHGVIDPIEEIGRLALEKNLLFHVDGCMGAFMLQYFRRLGAEVPPFDFRVPGVTSISMDLHKYGFAAKGASTILYRSKEYRRHQIYACAGWTGYTVVNPSVQSTKSGGPLAAAWAAMRFIGDDGYMRLAAQALEATRRVVDGIKKIPDLRVLGEPEMNLVAFTSDTVSIFHVIDEMNARGWYVQPQLAYGGSPENCHLSINPASVKWVDDLLRDLRECVEAARRLPSGQIGAQIKEMFGSLEPAALTPETFAQMLGMAGIQGTALPGRMAEINEIMNALSPALRERLLVEYANELFR